MRRWSWKHGFSKALDIPEIQATPMTDDEIVARLRGAPFDITKADPGMLRVLALLQKQIDGKMDRPGAHDGHYL